MVTFGIDGPRVELVVRTSVRCPWERQDSLFGSIFNQ